MDGDKREIKLPVPHPEFDQQPLNAVAVVVENPPRNKVLVKTSKKYKEPAIISGRGPLNENPNDPDAAAVIEVEHSIGVKNAKVERIYLDEKNMIGVYRAVIDEKEALESGGTADQKRWETHQEATGKPMIFGQENYIKIVLGEK